MWFDKKDPEELYPPKDEYQKNIVKHLKAL